MSLDYNNLFSKVSHDSILEKTEKPGIDDSPAGYSHN